MKILFQNIRIVSPGDGISGRYNLFISGLNIEKITKPEIVPENGYEVVDGSTLTAVPGFFDMHVHFRDPGQTEKEDIDSGIESAANGGFTGVLCMPNTKPAIDNAETVRYIYNKARGKVVDVLVSVCASENRAGNKITELESLRETCAAAITDDGSPLLNEEILKDVLRFSARYKIPFLQHAENYKLSGKGVIHKGEISEKLKVEGIPYESETATVINDIKFANEIKNSKYHVQHISCGDTVGIIREARITNKNISCEACPHHFILTDEAVIENGSNAKMNPPLREKYDVLKILEGLQDGTIEVICTDHAPHTSAEKMKGLNEAPFGIVGLESCVGLSYTYLVGKGIIPFEIMVENMSDNPRRLLNLPRVAIKVGEKANLTILETEKEWTIDSSKFKTKSRNTPFNGFRVKCKPFGVFNNGKFHKTNL